MVPLSPVRPSSTGSTDTAMRGFPMMPKTMRRPALILVHESEAACRQRLAAAGFAEPHVSEITSYLAQSTDMEPEFAALERACIERGVTFRPVALDDAPAVFPDCD